MKLIGYCIKCHKIRPVRVTRPQITRGVVLGVCDHCEQTFDTASGKRPSTR